jgi:hypothetical protein
MATPTEGVDDPNRSQRRSPKADQRPATWTTGTATARWRHPLASKGIWSGPTRCHDGGGSSERLAHVGEGVEVLVGGPARSQYDPVVYRSTRAPNLPNAVSASTATTRSSWRTCAKIDPTQAATVVWPIRVGGVVVTDHKPGRR